MPLGQETGRGGLGVTVPASTCHGRPYVPPPHPEEQALASGGAGTASKPEAEL